MSTLGEGSLEHSELPATATGKHLCLVELNSHGTGFAPLCFPGRHCPSLSHPVTHRMDYKVSQLVASSLHLSSSMLFIQFT